MAKEVKVKDVHKDVVKTTTSKGGRNADGTFAKGNKPKVTENYGRPSEDMSFRHQVKIRASKDPKMVQDVINNLISIASNPDHPKCIEAAEKLIKLNGNYDREESKVEVAGNMNTNQFVNLTKKEVESLLKKYDKR